MNVFEFRDVKELTLKEIYDEVLSDCKAKKMTKEEYNNRISKWLIEREEGADPGTYSPETWMEWQAYEYGLLGYFYNTIKGYEPYCMKTNKLMADVMNASLGCAIIISNRVNRAMTKNDDYVAEHTMDYISAGEIILNHGLMLEYKEHSDLIANIRRAWLRNEVPTIPIKEGYEASTI